MKSKAIIRNTIIILVVIAAAFAGYLFFFNKPAATTGSGLSTSTVPTAVSTGSAAPLNGLATTAGLPDTGSAAGSNIGDGFLTTLLSLQSINFDSSIFTNPAYISLQDFDRPLPPAVNPGRPNPFAPIGVDASAGVASAQISTGNPSAITGTASTLNGTLLVGNPNVLRWFAYGTTATTLTSMTPEKIQTTPGAFAEVVTGLIPNTTYYAEAMALVAGQTVVGNSVTWKTAQASANAK